MHYSKKTAAGCRIARDLLSTWPFQTDAGSSFVSSPRLTLSLAFSACREHNERSGCPTGYRVAFPAQDSP